MKESRFDTSVSTECIYSVDNEECQARMDNVNLE